jgi:hypothetical protein
MKRCRTALVGGVRIRAVIEQDVYNSQVPRAHGLMKRCDPITVPRIDEPTSLDEQPGDMRRPRAVYAPKICHTMKGSLAETIRHRDVRTAIEKVSGRSPR